MDGLIEPERLRTRLGLLATASEAEVAARIETLLGLERHQAAVAFVEDLVHNRLIADYAPVRAFWLAAALYDLNAARMAAGLRPEPEKA